MLELVEPIAAAEFWGDDEPELGGDVAGPEGEAPEFGLETPPPGGVIRP
jgi:hypothetical protein